MGFFSKIFSATPATATPATATPASASPATTPASASTGDRYISIDVETANSARNSICQIGVVVIEGDTVVDSFNTLVNPEDEFGWVEMSIHGISPEDVIDAPKFGEVYDHLSGLLAGEFTMQYSKFDRSAINGACEKYGLKNIDTKWIDVMKAVRRTLPEFKERGYGLANVCDSLNYEFNHHDAFADAMACAHIGKHIMSEKNWDLATMSSEIEKKLTYKSNYQNQFKGASANTAGELFGAVIVFTGALIASRKECALVASQKGCEVIVSVTKKATVLVVGDQDMGKMVSGETLSSKHRKAITLQEKGSALRIIGESEFWNMAS